VAKKFQRKIEDFTCEHCGFKVKGNGYTNHCPNCLWSKHVDINPGDRLQPCGGMMEPVFLILEKKGYKITQQCQKCGEEHNCKASPEDRVEAFIELSKTLAKKAMF
jgi:primosomal protein N'